MAAWREPGELDPELDRAARFPQPEGARRAIIYIPQLDDNWLLSPGGRHHARREGPDE